MAAKSLTEMTDKQLESEWTKAAKDFDKQKELLKEFSQEHQRRAADKRAAELLETMSDDEKRALVQMAQADGIESEEKVQG